MDGVFYILQVSWAESVHDMRVSDFATHQISMKPTNNTNNLQTYDDKFGVFYMTANQFQRLFCVGRYNIAGPWGYGSSTFLCL